MLAIAKFLIRYAVLPLTSSLAATIAFGAIPDLVCGAGYTASGPGGGAAVGLFALFMAFPMALILSLLMEVKRRERTAYIWMPLLFPSILAAVASYLWLAMPCAPY
jgi:hypothetical protein